MLIDFINNWRTENSLDYSCSFQGEARCRPRMRREASGPSPYTRGPTREMRPANTGCLASSATSRRQPLSQTLPCEYEEQMNARGRSRESDPSAGPVTRHRIPQSSGWSLRRRCRVFPKSGVRCSTYGHLTQTGRLSAALQPTSNVLSARQFGATKEANTVHHHPAGARVQS